MFTLVKGFLKSFGFKKIAYADSGKTALKIFEPAMRSALAALNIKRGGKALNLIGKIYLAPKKYDEAIEYLKQASAMSPANISRKIEVGDTLLKLGLPNDAAEAFDSIRDVDITDLNRTAIGAAYLAYGDLKKAGGYLDKTVDPVADTLPVFSTYAMALSKEGEYNKSIAQYEKCLNIKPDYPIARYNTGRVYYEIKEYEKAVEALEKCLELEPGNEIAKTLKKHITTKYLSKNKP